MWLLTRIGLKSTMLVEKRKLLSVWYRSKMHIVLFITRNVNIWVKIMITRATNLIPSQARLKQILKNAQTHNGKEKWKGS